MTRPDADGLDWFCRQMLLTSLEGYVSAYREYQAAYSGRLELIRRPHTAPTDSIDSNAFFEKNEELARETNYRKWFLLIAAWQIYRYRDWAISRGVAFDCDFAELLPFKDDVYWMRNLNEHADEYFAGEGRHRKHWVYDDGDGTADASSIVNGKLGNRLDPSEFLAAVETVRRWLFCS